nr:PREDICTED: uncharacterized protein LOC103552495 [Equus przewalskii]
MRLLTLRTIEGSQNLQARPGRLLVRISLVAKRDSTTQLDYISRRPSLPACFPPELSQLLARGPFGGAPRGLMLRATWSRAARRVESQCRSGPDRGLQPGSGKIAAVTAGTRAGVPRALCPRGRGLGPRGRIARLSLLGRVASSGPQDTRTAPRLRSPPGLPALACRPPDGATGTPGCLPWAVLAAACGLDVGAPGCFSDTPRGARGGSGSNYISQRAALPPDLRLPFRFRAVLALCKVSCGFLRLLTATRRCRRETTAGWKSEAGNAWEVLFGGTLRGSYMSQNLGVPNALTPGTCCKRIYIVQALSCFPLDDVCEQGGCRPGECCITNSFCAPRKAWRSVTPHPVLLFPKGRTLMKGKTWFTSKNQCLG